jgi:hypothetical protein
VVIKPYDRSVVVEVKGKPQRVIFKRKTAEFAERVGAPRSRPDKGSFGIR